MEREPSPMVPGSKPAYLDSTMLIIILLIHTSAGHQHSDLTNLAQQVIVPLKNGLYSFNKLSEMILSMNADILLPGYQTFDDIRQEIWRMKIYLDRSEQIAITELQGINKETEDLTAEESSLVNQKRNREGELENLRTQLQSYKSNLWSYYKALGTERSNLASAEQTLNHMRRKRNEAEKIRDVGIGLMAIPILGWIAGSVMVGVGQTDMNKASEQVNRARREVENAEYQIRYYSNKVSEYEGLISKAQSDIQDTDWKIQEMETKLRALSVKREAVADFQGKVREAVRDLGKLSGVGSVAELQTRRLILLEPMMKVMEEMMAALEQITGDELLYREGIQSIMRDVRNNHRELQELRKLHEASSGDGSGFY